MIHKTMIPILDFNHSYKDNTYWLYKYLDAVYSLISWKDIVPNEEITDSHGQYYNSCLHTKYRFIIPSNINYEYINFNIYDYLINTLNKKFEYYFDIKNKCERYNLKVVIKEHIDIMNKTIRKIKEY